ncbi:MAG: hypothetical protein V1907_00110 [Candidatus Kerfeldbacteria bacterium]
MPERFHYQTPDGEKPFDKNQVEDLFLMLNLEKARKLAKDHSLKKPPENIHSVVDISDILKDGMEWEEIVPVIQAGGFEGVNIGTDQIDTVEHAEQVRARLEASHTKAISFHGSLDPYFIGTSEHPNGALVRHDFEIADAVDQERSSPINYDLVAAELPDINEFQRGRTLADIHQKQRGKLAEKGVHSEKELIERIIRYVAENRPAGNTRPAMFETRQSIIMESPDITEENLEHVVTTCRKYFDDDEQWGLTVDVGHIVGALPRDPNVKNVSRMREEAERILKVLEKYKQHIKMVHVSGTVTAHTSASYTLAEREGIDPEAVKAWSMHQVIDNQFIVEMVERIRDIMGDRQFIEDSEVRPIDSAAKYFGDTLHFDKDTSRAVHKEQLQLQAEILGYNKD